MLNRLARCRVKSFFHAPRAAEPMAGYPGEQLQSLLALFSRKEDFTQV
jgi:hypothetical protein